MRKTGEPEISHSGQPCLEEGNVGTDDLEERFIALRLVFLDDCHVSKCLHGGSNQESDDFLQMLGEFGRTGNVNEVELLQETFSIHVVI